MEFIFKKRSFLELEEGKTMFEGTEINNQCPSSKGVYILIELE